MINNYLRLCAQKCKIFLGKKFHSLLKLNFKKQLHHLFYYILLSWVMTTKIENKIQSVGITFLYGVKGCMKDKRISNCKFSICTLMKQ